MQGTVLRRDDRLDKGRGNEDTGCSPEAYGDGVHRIFLLVKTVENVRERKKAGTGTYCMSRAFRRQSNRSA